MRRGPDRRLWPVRHGPYLQDDGGTLDFGLWTLDFSPGLPLAPWLQPGATAMRQPPQPFQRLSASCLRPPLPLLSAVLSAIAFLPAIVATTAGATAEALAKVEA